MSNRNHEKRPRVLIIVQNLPVPFDRRVWLECRALRDAGYDVHVVCPKAPGDPTHTVLDGVTLHKYRPAPSGTGAIELLGRVRLVAADDPVAHRARVRRRTVRHDSGVQPARHLLDRRARLRVTGCRFVYDQHDLCPELLASRFAEPSPVCSPRCCCGSSAGPTARPHHVIATNESYARVAMSRGRKRPR